MKKWYCDRCGNEIDFENHGNIITREYYNYGRILFWINKKHIEDSHEAELCNDCMLSYFRWFLNNGKEINNHVTSAIKEDIMKLESKEDDS